MDRVVSASSRTGLKEKREAERMEDRMKGETTNSVQKSKDRKEAAVSAEFILPKDSLEIILTIFLESRIVNINYNTWLLVLFSIHFDFTHF